MGIKESIVKRVLQYSGKKMDGKKTYFGGAGKILTGIGLFISAAIGIIGIMFPDLNLPKMSVEEIFTILASGAYAFSSGLSSIGIGHKIEKQKPKAVVNGPIIEEPVRNDGSPV
jgi:hypothetical protein